jgi:hypothetical protein
MPMTTGFWPKVDEALTISSLALSLADAEDDGMLSARPNSEIARIAVVVAVADEYVYGCYEVVMRLSLQREVAHAEEFATEYT